MRKGDVPHFGPCQTLEDLMSRLRLQKKEAKAEARAAAKALKKEARRQQSLKKRARELSVADLLDVLAVKRAADAANRA